MRSWLWKMKSLSGRVWLLSWLWTVWNDCHQPGRNGREAWEKFQEQPADILLTDINMPQMNGLDLAAISSKSSLRLVISFFWPVMMTLSLRGKPSLGADDYLLKPFSKDDIEEMLAKVKGKLDQRAKKAQVEDLVSHGYSTDLEEAIHARLADSQLTLKGFGLSTWFKCLLSKCIDQEKLGLPFPRLPHSRANEEGSTLASHDRSKDLWDRRSGWFWRYELFFSTL